jgi:hypothetical protein
LRHGQLFKLFLVTINKGLFEPGIHGLTRVDGFTEEALTYVLAVALVREKVMICLLEVLGVPPMTGVEACLAYKTSFPVVIRDLTELFSAHH